MTIIKQKGVMSERHATNVRAYLNDKDAVMRDTWNLVFPKRWFAEMEQTRRDFGHDKAARGGARNTIMYHQILAFLPEECSCNGGPMTPELCMRYAYEWVVTRYPNQQVAFALHEESDKNGKRYAVHMAINRSDLITKKRLDEGRGRRAANARAQAVRKLDAEWGLQQVEEGVQNSVIRPRSKSNERKPDVERIMTERDDDSSYKNNLRYLIDHAIEKVPEVTDLDSFKRQMRDWGVSMSVSHKRLYATDMDILESGNPKHTFRLDRMDIRYTIDNLESAFARKRIGNGQPAPGIQPKEAGMVKQIETERLTDKEAYMIRLDMAWDAYEEHLKMLSGRPMEELPDFKIPRIPNDLRKDAGVLNKTSDKLIDARNLRERIGHMSPGQLSASVRAKVAGSAQRPQAQPRQQVQQPQQRQHEQNRNR